MRTVPLYQQLLQALLAATVANFKRPVVLDAFENGPAIADWHPMRTAVERMGATVTAATQATLAQRHLAPGRHQPPLSLHQRYPTA